MIDPKDLENEPLIEVTIKAFDRVGKVEYDVNWSHHPVFSNAGIAGLVRDAADSIEAATENERCK